MPESDTCRVCGAENPPGRLFCGRCGVYLQDDEDTWVDLPPVPTSPTTPSGTARTPAPGSGPPAYLAPPAPPAPAPQAAPAAAPMDPARRAPEAAGSPQGPPPRRRRWLLALVLATLLFVALAAVTAVVYRALSSSDEPEFTDTVTTAAPTSTTSVVESSTTSTTEQGASTTSTGAPGPGRPVKVESSEASSTLPAAGGNTYGAANVVDDDISTCWSEGVEGDGVGESIRLGLQGPTRLTAIEIANGYQKDERRFYGNPRVGIIRIEYSDGTKREVNLHDDLGFQSITPPETPVEWVEFTIGSTYAGDTWEDTSISEIRLYAAE
jgi:hypothetical protein